MRLVLGLHRRVFHLLRSPGEGVVAALGRRGILGMMLAVVAAEAAKVFCGLIGYIAVPSATAIMQLAILPEPVAAQVATDRVEDIV